MAVKSRPPQHDLAKRPLLAGIQSCWTALARRLASGDAPWAPDEIQRRAREATEAAVFGQLCRGRGVDLSPAAASRLGAADHATRFCLERLAEADILSDLCHCPVEILGHVHQHLLGQSIRRIAGAPPEIAPDWTTRKQVGVFYTPQYVGRYMAQRALGQGPHALAEIRSRSFKILDPACGCGSLLVAACRHLLGRSGNGEVPCATDDLAGCLHGVDVDPEAVLVARRSLWLQLVQSGADPTDDCLLDALARNLRTGDVLSDASGAELSGAFGAVIGNPPYRRELGSGDLLRRVSHTELGRRYRMPRMDLLFYFIHRGLQCLKPGGRLSFIVSQYWTSGRGASKLVGALENEAHVEEIFSLGRLAVFDKVSGRHMILCLRRGASDGTTVVKIADDRHGPDAEPYLRGAAPVHVFQKTAGQLFRSGRLDLEPPADSLLAGLARWTPLGQLGMVRQGIVENPASVTRAATKRHHGCWEVGQGVFALTQAELQALDLSPNEQTLIRPYHALRDLRRYFVAPEPSRHVIYSTEKTCPDLKRFPTIAGHLRQFRPIMEARRETRLGIREWWQLHWPREARIWESPKIVALQMAPRPAFAPAHFPVYVPFSVNVFMPAEQLREHLNYIAALLNSKLLWKWFRHHAKRRGVGMEINGHVLRHTPIRRIDFSDPADRRRHDALVKLVDRYQAIQSTSGGHMCSRLDAEIDQRVYELYDLSQADIALVESVT